MIRDGQFDENSLFTQQIGHFIVVLYIIRKIIHEKDTAVNNWFHTRPNNQP